MRRDLLAGLDDDDLPAVAAALDEHERRFASRVADVIETARERDTTRARDAWSRTHQPRPIEQTKAARFNGALISGDERAIWRLLAEGEPDPLIAEWWLYVHGTSMAGSEIRAWAEAGA